MARLPRLALLFGTLISVSTAIPGESHAGVIPWVYDAVFGPVGSIRSGAGYAPMYAGYRNSGYAPMSVAYAPTTAAAYGAYGMSSGYFPQSASGCSCNQSSAYYPPAYGSYYGSSQPVYGQSYYGNSGCSSCASGNCSTGGSSMPMSSGYGPSGVTTPTPDPQFNQYNSNSRDVDGRLNELERQLRILDHRQKEDEKFLGRQYEDKYKPDPYSSSTYRDSYRDQGVPVPQRRRNEFNSGPAEQDFSQPLTPRRRPGTRPPTEINEELNKPDLSAPKSVEENPTGKDKDSDRSTNASESEPQTLRLDNRITSKAVAPRVRMQIVTNQTKTLVAKLNKKTVKTSENPPATELARH